MTKKTDFQILNAFENLVTDFHGGPMNKYYSSVVELDNELRAIGAVSPVPVFCEYKYPDGQSAAEYERLVCKFSYLVNFQPEQITNLKSWFFSHGPGRFMYPMNDEELKADPTFQIYNNAIANLDDATRQKLAQYISDKVAGLVQNVTRQVADMRKLNPQLANVYISNDVRDMIEFLFGCAYLFHYEDIEYFINTPMGKRNADKKRFEKSGVSFNSIFRPDRAQKIVDAVLAVRNKETKEIG